MNRLADIPAERIALRNNIFTEYGSGLEDNIVADQQSQDGEEYCGQRLEPGLSLCLHIAPPLFDEFPAIPETLRKIFGCNMLAIICQIDSRKSIIYAPYATVSKDRG
jgi:hypothetical protein